jgi:hypothetical protein
MSQHECRQRAAGLNLFMPETETRGSLERVSEDVDIRATIYQ